MVAVNVGGIGTRSIPIHPPPAPWPNGIVSPLALYITILIPMNQPHDDRLASHPAARRATSGAFGSGRSLLSGSGDGGSSCRSVLCARRDQAKSCRREVESRRGLAENSSGWIPAVDPLGSTAADQIGTVSRAASRRLHAGHVPDCAAMPVAREYSRLWRSDPKSAGFAGRSPPRHASRQAAA